MKQGKGLQVLPQAEMLSCQGFITQMSFFSAQQLQAYRPWLQSGSSAGSSASGSPFLMCQHQQFWQSVSLCTGNINSLAFWRKKNTRGSFQLLKFSSFYPKNQDCAAGQAACWQGWVCQMGPCPRAVVPGELVPAPWTGATGHLRQVGLWKHTAAEYPPHLCFLCCPWRALHLSSALNSYEQVLLPASAESKPMCTIKNQTTTGGTRSPLHRVLAGTAEFSVRSSVSSME